MITLILALLLGTITFIFTEYNKSESKRFIDFILIKENYIAAILNLMTGLIIILAWYFDNNALLVAGISKITFLTAAILGFTGNKVWQSIAEGTSKRVKTKAGLNK